MEHDAIIIGGGPAGATAATYLARGGKKVLVLEKEHFPRFHIGESLLPYNMPIFEEMEVLGEIESAGFVKKFGGRFAMARGDAENAITFAEGSFTEQPEALQVERSRFDKILLDHARRCGAEVLEGHAVKDFSVTDEEVTVTATDDEGTEKTFQARFLIDASGLSSFTATRQKLRHFLPHLQKVAIYAHFSGIQCSQDTCNQTETLIVCFENAWFWVIPFSAETVSIGLVIDRNEVKNAGLPPEKIFRNAVASSPRMSRILDGAEPTGKFHVTSDYSYSNDALVSPRLARIGDAAGFLDPVFSSGVYLACKSARAASQAVAEALESGQPMTAGLRAYEKATRRTLNQFLEVIELFYRQSFVEILLQPEPVLRWPCAINALLAGRPDQPWPLRWRLKTFFWFARIHQKRKLVKPLEFGKAKFSETTP